MKRHTKGSLQYLQFDLLSDCPKISHGVLTRHGGVSQAPFTSLNLGFSSGDTKENIAANLKIIQETLGIPKIAVSSQVHKTDIIEVTPSSDINAGEADALMTSVKDIGLMIRHADCQAAIFYDPKEHVAAVAHSGWRGSVENIYKKTIESLSHSYGSKPENILVCISPSLGPTHAEFINFRTELPQSFWGFQVRENYFDFWEISRWQLKMSGILPHHIEIAGISTYDNTDDYFSYRKEKTTGRNGTFIRLIF